MHINGCELCHEHNQHKTTDVFKMTEVGVQRLYTQWKV